RIRLNVLVEYVMEYMKYLPSMAGKLKFLRRKNERHWTIDGYDLEPLLDELREIEIAAKQQAAEVCEQVGEKSHRPGVRWTWEERVQAVLKVVRQCRDNNGKDKGVKIIIKELKGRGFAQRPQTTRQILRELKKNGKYNGLN